MPCPSSAQRAEVVCLTSAKIETGVHRPRVKYQRRLIIQRTKLFSRRTGNTETSRRVDALIVRSGGSARRWNCEKTRNQKHRALIFLNTDFFEFFFYFYATSGRRKSSNGVLPLAGLLLFFSFQFFLFQTKAESKLKIFQFLFFHRRNERPCGGRSVSQEKKSPRVRIKKIKINPD